MIALQVLKFKDIFMRKILFGLLFLLSISVFAEAFVPEVIPALQNWKNYRGKYAFPKTGVIVLKSEDSEVLKQTAELLSSDLKEMFGYDYSVSVTDGKVKNGIILSLSADDETYGDEGYALTVNNRIEIEANTMKGILWGTRTLLQFIYNQPDGIQKGKAVDSPQYVSRGFMLDVGRKFFTMDFLKDYVRILSFYKMNEFQIHLNDNSFPEFADENWNEAYSAFRLESERYPGLTAKDGSYTKEEFREFQRYAASYGVKVIPEIDVPAHSLAFTHYNPRLAAENKEYGFDHLDLYKKEVYDFIDNLFDEYLSGDDPVFIGDEVHIGTDEYNKKEAEQFRKFTQHYIDFIKKYGKTPRLWGSLKEMSGETEVNLEGSVVSSWNFGWMDLQSALDAGAKVVNMCDRFLYIVPAVNYYHDFLDLEWLYNNWTPELMNDVRIEKNPNLLGAMFAEWNDRVGNGITAYDVHIRCFPAVQLLSDKLWKGENFENVPFEKFRKLCEHTPEAPGVNISAVPDRVYNITEEGQIIKLGGRDVVENSLDEVGYPYYVEFEIKSPKEPCIDAVLFDGPHSEFIANWHNTGKFAFRREGVEYVFHAFKLPANKWKHIRIEGDYKGTTIYVDGVMTERLEGRIHEVYNFRYDRKDKIWFQETLVFPLKYIGHKNMGFRGEIRNVVVGPMAD